MLIHDDHGDYEDDHLGDDDDGHYNFCTQTLGAGSVEEQLAFEARYEFVTKVCHRHQQVFHSHQKIFSYQKDFDSHQNQI